MADPVTLAIAGTALVLNLLLSFIFPVKTKQEGARLDNLDVTGSSYGSVLVWGRGTFRTAGQVIWIKNNKITEVVTTETQGGKGGPQVTTTTYSYYGNFAVAFTSRSITGISRIWLNRKTVYNIGGAADEATAKNSAAWAAKYVRFYVGDPLQGTDPLIQSVLGATNTPAYRYGPFMVLENLPLADYGNTLPQVEAEIVVDGRWFESPPYYAPDNTPVRKLFRLDVQLSSIVDELCTIASLQPGEWDSSDLDFILVYGYTQSGIKSVASILEELRKIYFFDIIESDKIYFRRQQRNGLTTTIPNRFLAAHEGGSDRPVDYKISQKNPPELPIEIALTFRDPDRDYQQNSAYARRQGDSYYNKLSVQTDAVLYKSQAQTIVDRYLAQIWAEKDTYAISIPGGFMALEANDVIGVEVQPGQTEAVKIQKVTLGANNLLQIEGTNGTYSLISISFQGDLSQVGENTPVYGLPVSDLDILDIPLIRASDTEIGVYAIASGNERWKSASLYGSLQQNTGYIFAGTLQYSSTYGRVAIATPQALTGIVDRTTTIRVRLQNTRMSLYSITYGELLEGANLILIGSEVMQYQTATQVDDDEWDLSVLIRGVSGTEWAVYSHTANERFVFLSGYCQRVPMTRDRIGQTGYWKAPVPGQALDEVTAIVDGYNGVDLRPYSPVRLEAEKVATDYHLSWVRRDRKGGWYDYQDTEMSESIEQYLVSIWAGASTSAPVKTYPIIGIQAQVYTAAEVVADFGVLPSSFYFSVQQFSSYVGYGYSSDRQEVLT